MADLKADSEPVVLVVEDEVLLRFCAADSLHEKGFAVVEAASAEEALAILETRDDVRVLFTDIGIAGDINGLDLARQVHERWPNIRLVMTSGGPEPDKAEIPEEGRFIAKPYSPDEITGEIDKLLKKS